jgi:endonuclease/exonuclease/phosphatase family metal-dependent hydrolase
MPPFPAPKTSYDYDLETELKALRKYERTKPGRDVPDKSDDHLLIATWNIANLGVQKRQEKDYRLIAEIVGWFDLIAIQEVNDDLTGLREIQKQLPAYYRVIFTDASGNRERFAFCYDSRKVRILEEVGEIAIAVAEAKKITLPTITTTFPGFDRTPFFATFRAQNGSGSFEFLLATVHLYFGDESKPRNEASAGAMDRRVLETYAVARWCDLRRKSARAYVSNVIALGDFNLPRPEVGDPVYDALVARGIELPEHSDLVGGSNLNGDKFYDQMAFVPGLKKSRLVRSGTFDFDGALFSGLWNESPNGPLPAAELVKKNPEFFKFVRFHISDHRPLWAQIKI